MSVVAGTSEDTRLEEQGFCDGICMSCNTDLYNIPSDRVSLCVHCGAEIFPCNSCGNGCDWNLEQHGCHRFKHSEDCKEFEITIVETLEKKVAVLARDQAEALAQVKNAWNNSVHVLNASHFTNVAFRGKEEIPE